MGIVKNSYFLNRNNYGFRPYAFGGLSGEKQIAVPPNGKGASYIIKGNSRECACNEFMGLRLAKMLGANVPDAYLVEPKENMYEVAIEYLGPMLKPDFNRVKAEKNLLHEYVYGFIAHCLLMDRDTVDFLFSNNMIYTFDFGDAFGIDDFSIGIMENASELASILPAPFLSKFTSPGIEYHPETLYAYETLVNDLKICDKAYFDAALDDMCSRFLAIPEEEIKGMLNALGVQYPAALVNYFERFIDKMRKFCQK